MRSWHAGLVGSKESLRKTLALTAAPDNSMSCQAHSFNLGGLATWSSSWRPRRRRGPASGQGVLKRLVGWALHSAEQHGSVGRKRRRPWSFIRQRQHPAALTAASGVFCCALCFAYDSSTGSARKPCRRRGLRLRLPSWNSASPSDEQHSLRK